MREFNNSFRCRQSPRFLMILFLILILVLTRRGVENEYEKEYCSYYGKMGERLIGLEWVCDPRSISE